MDRLIRRMAAVSLAAVLSFTVLCGSVPDGNRSDSLTAAAAPAEIPGIDVSKYQEEIDWSAVAQSGEKFAILRCCKVIRAYDDWELDPRFEENYAGAKAAGLAVGCYMYTDAATETEFSEDVAYMLGFLKDKSFEFPVFVDLESASRQEHLSPKVFMPALLSGLEQIEAAGHTAGVYSSFAFYSECIDRQQLRDLGYPIWEAHYFNSVNGLPTPSGHDLSDRATIWQYSGNGRTGGIRTTVDRNVCYTYQFFNHMASLTDSELPSGVLTEGEEFSVSGLVRSGLVLRSLTGTIARITPGTEEEESVQNVTVYPHAKEYRLAGFFTKKLVFSELTEGEYIFRMTGVDSAGESFEIVNAPFTVAPERAVTAPVVITATEPTLTQEGIVYDTDNIPTVATQAGTTATTLTAAQKDSPHASAGLRLMLWFYRHFTVRKFFTGLTRLCLKLRLERTPFYRIVSYASYRLEAKYLAAGLAVGIEAEEA